MEILLLYLVCILSILLVLSSIFIFEFIVRDKLRTHDTAHIQKIYIPTPNTSNCNNIDSRLQPKLRTNIYHNSDIRIHPHAKPSYNVMMNGGYQQLGTLSTSTNNTNPIILPLFGRKINRHRWEYYTATDRNHQIRINLTYKNRNCEDDFGCDEIENGDEVYVPTYSKTFTANMYKYNSIIYKYFSVVGVVV